MKKPPTAPTPEAPLRDGAPDVPPPRGWLIGKNLTVVGLLYVVRAGAGFFAMAYLARELGGRTFGIYVAALSLVTIVQAVDELGGTDYLVKEGARDPERMERLLSDVLFLKVGTTIVLLVVAIGAAAIMGFDQTELAVVGLLVFREGAESLSDALRAPLKAIERMELASATAIAVTVASALALIGGVAAGLGLVGAVGLSAAVTVLGVPVAYVVTRRHVTVRLRASVRDALRAARQSFPFAVVEMLSFATTYADTLVIRIALGQRATGIYGATTRVVFALWSVAVIYEISSYRTLSYYAHRDRPMFARFAERSAAGLFMAGIPFAVGGAIIGGRLLVWIFGLSYAGGTEVFQLLLWSLPAAFAAIVLMSAIVADDRPQDAGWIFAGAFVSNVVANIVLVPMFGIEAAGWTTIGTEVLLVAAASAVLAARRLPMTWPVLALPGVVAGAAMAAVVYPLRHQPLAIPIAAGAAVYLGMLLVLRVPQRLGLTRATSET